MSHAASRPEQHRGEDHEPRRPAAVVPPQDRPADRPQHSNHDESRAAGREAAVSSTGALVLLSKSDLALSDPDEDVRGRRVQDVARQDLGLVEDLLVDSESWSVRMLVIAHGGLLGIGVERVYLPVEAVTDVGERVLRVGQDRQRIAGAPLYDPDLTDEPPLVDQLGYYGAVYGYYGYMPFWGDRPAP